MRTGKPNNKGLLYKKPIFEQLADLKVQAQQTARNYTDHKPIKYLLKN